KEVFPPAGCCTVAFDEGVARFLPQGIWGAGRSGLYAACYGSSAVLILALFAATRRGHAPPGPRGLALLLLRGVVALAAFGVFLIDVAAPVLLRLPYHHCPYDLIPQVPEAVAAVTLFLGGCFFLGWACVARWFGHSPETEPFLPGAVRGLLRLSLWA